MHAFDVLGDPVRPTDQYWKGITMSTYEVTRTETIGATPDRITPLITRFPAWQQWSPFERSDPELRRSYRGPAEGAGAEFERGLSALKTLAEARADDPT
ncbi:hypothetical protein [Kribbella sp. HUAS MG21]|uniref:Uncharacterized protein n=1 Tax=Kribbella sp. HUAS MG21 TaxID=3160966 RepID=A0AAU7TF74_9ACTN